MPDFNYDYCTPEQIIKNLEDELAEARKENAALASELSRLRAVEEAANNWQPIETAPKDGTHILLACSQCPPAFVSEGYYEEDGDRGWFQANTHWTDAHDGSLVNVTHWMPLPKPPATQGAKQ